MLRELTVRRSKFPDGDIPYSIVSDIMLSLPEILGIY